jgi:hypothetical protein
LRLLALKAQRPVRLNNTGQLRQRLALQAKA